MASVSLVNIFLLYNIDFGYFYLVKGATNYFLPCVLKNLITILDRHVKNEVEQILVDRTEPIIFPNFLYHSEYFQHEILLNY